MDYSVARYMRGMLVVIGFLLVLAFSMMMLPTSGSDGQVQASDLGSAFSLDKIGCVMQGNCNPMG